ncbi:hypothetical protein AB1Y20_000122 [Prymnesium parvum]|uniref:26S proteasome non-ATPase regulatory subunit 5 n=1 Tax=Prymnesium parvum TaxID=97485 RepID=A0AB34K7A0_PRYPA
MDSLGDFRPPPAEPPPPPDELLQQLSSATLEELRTSRLPLLFAAIDAATLDVSPQITSIVRRAFDGDEGLAALRAPSTLPFLERGVEHPDDLVRSYTIDQLRRLAATDLPHLRPVLPKIAAAIHDPALRVSESAAAFFAAVADAGVGPLRLLLSDETVASLTQTLRRAADPIALRAANLLCALASKGEAQLGLCVELELLAPVLELWRQGDPLVRLNLIEIFGALALSAAGFEWLRAGGIVAELCRLVDWEAEEDAIVALQRPAALHCLGSLLEAGGDAAVDLLLKEEQIVSRLWPFLTAAAGEHSAALVLLRGAAASAVGAAQLLERGLDGLQPLPAMMRSHDERVRVGAFSVSAQLCATMVAHNSLELPALVLTLQGLISSAAASASSSAADTIAQVACSSFSEALRTSALSLLLSLAQLHWGAAALCSSESTLELLLSSAASFPVGPNELRQKHAIAQLLVSMPVASTILGADSGVMQSLRKYAQNGPFHPQRPRAAKAAAPLTL